MCFDHFLARLVLLGLLVNAANAMLPPIAMGCFLIFLLATAVYIRTTSNIGIGEDIWTVLGIAAVSCLPHLTSWDQLPDLVDQSHHSHRIHLCTSTPQFKTITVKYLVPWIAWTCQLRIVHGPAVCLRIVWKEPSAIAFIGLVAFSVPLPTPVLAWQASPTDTVQSILMAVGICIAKTRTTLKSRVGENHYPLPQHRKHCLPKMKGSQWNRHRCCSLQGSVRSLCNRMSHTDAFAEKDHATVQDFFIYTSLFATYKMFTIVQLSLNIHMWQYDTLCVSMCHIVSRHLSASTVGKPAPGAFEMKSWEPGEENSARKTISIWYSMVKIGQMVVSSDHWTPVSLFNLECSGISKHDSPSSLV